MRLHELTALELAERMSVGDVSAVEVCEAFFDRTRQIEPTVGAYITRCPERALAAAASVDTRRAAGEILPPLAGVPISLKDNICLEGIKTTCASKMLEDFVPFYSAAVAERCEAGGLVVTGKTNLDEFAMGSTCESSALQNSFNPHNPRRVTGGSSGGAAACVASGQTPLALGSDTGGSIRGPASYCGVVGLKPTYGAVSRWGVVAFASSFDQVGPLGRSVADVAALYDLIAGRDARDAMSHDAPFGSVSEKLTGEVAGLKIGLPKEYFGQGVAPYVRDTVRAAAGRYEAMGADGFEISLPMMEYALPVYYILTSAEASSNLARFDGVRYGKRADASGTLMDLYCNSRSENFGAEVKRRIMLGTYVLSAGYYDAYYSKALKARRRVRAEFADAFQKCDLILTPVTPTVAPPIGHGGSPLEEYAADICTVSVNIAGVTALSMPCGTKDGLPIGMQLIGSAWGEPTVLNAAYAYEQAVGGVCPVAGEGQA